MEQQLFKAAPSLVQIGKIDIREVYGERLCVANAILAWPNTNEARAQVAIWKHVVAARLLDDVCDLTNDEIYNVAIEGLDFLNISGTKKQWGPIVDALKQAGYKPARKQSRKTDSLTRITRKRFESLRLKPELVPSSLWRRSLCSTLGRHSSQWRAIRKQVIESTDGKCDICRARQEKGMICHEQWNYDDTQHIAMLVGFELVCADCNLVLHGGWSSVLTAETAQHDPAKALELWIRRETHMERVNGITAEEKQAVQEYAGALHAKRSKHTWNVGISAELIQCFPFLYGIKL